MAKQMIPSYKVTRNFTNPEDKHYLVHIQDSKPTRIRKISNSGKYNWYAKTRYFVSLRDAIVYCAFGVH